MGTSSNSVKQALLEEYGSFSDRRIKNLEKGSEFVVDDRSEGGLASDGTPYGWFCTILAEVTDASAVKVSLGNSVPQGRSVAAWAESNGVPVSDRSLEFTVSPRNLEMLMRLADAMSAIVARGAPRYEVANYKYACPRVAASLARLAKVLSKTWNE